MITHTKSVWISRFGLPQEVAGVCEFETPAPGVGEVLLQMEFAPINPADLNVLEGKYGTLPALPVVPGIEGCGRIVQVGQGVDALFLEKRVLLPFGFGSWRQLGVASLQDLTLVPESVPVQQAAMLRINPVTAWCLLHEICNLEPGEWVVQNAANSGVGRSVIQIARACGWRTVNVVRRGGLEAELRGIGADAVVEEGDHLAQRITEVTGKAPLRLAFNAVGGESALGLAKALSEGGTLVTYGAMGLQPLRIPNGLLIFKDLTFRGFWVSQWAKKVSREKREAMFSRLFEWAANGVLHTPVEAVYALEQIHEALLHANRPMRTGKVLLQG